MTPVASASGRHYAPEPLSEQVAELVDAARQELDEDVLLDRLATDLSRYRALYRHDRSLFTPTTIEALQLLATAEQGLRNFTDILVDSAEVRTRDDCDDLITQIAALKDTFAGWAIVGRLDKEIRELRERAQSLPTYQSAASAGTRNHKLAQIQQLGTDPCPCCDARMLIRGSAFGYFWGCETFPKCFGRRWLKREHLAVLSHR